MIPARFAAKIFSLIPPTANTFPRSVISPVIAKLAFTFLCAIDPNGLSYKMQEFFDLWGMSAFNGTTLWLSVFMNAFEIFAGVALLLGWRPKLINWLLLLLIIFFTFLTGYAYLSGKFKSCGCFGDCIPITSGVSFAKDIILLVLILFLFFNSKYISPVFSKRVTAIFLIISAAFTFLLQWYVLNYLPIVDCLPYKVGNNIRQKMQMPANAVPDSTVINFVYKKDGKDVSFTADNFPADFDDSTYTFVKREDKIIRPGKNNIPAIRSFTFSDKNGVEMGQAILDSPHIFLLFVEDMSQPLSKWQQGFERFYEIAKAQNIPVYLITSTRSATEAAIANTSFKEIPVLDGDRVLIRAAARVIPTLFQLKKGTITGKWSFRQFAKAQKAINNVP